MRPGGSGAPELDKLTLRLNASTLKCINAGGLFDQVWTVSYLFDTFKRFKSVKVDNWGRGVEMKMKDKGNQTAKANTPYGEYDTTPGTGARPAIFDPKILTATAVISEHEIDELEDAEDKDIVRTDKEKTSDALAAMTNELEDWLHNSGTDPDEIFGLFALVSATPTANPSAGNVGGIDRSVSANSYYRNQVASGAIGAAATNLKPALRSLYSKCHKAAPANFTAEKREPTTIILDWDAWDALEASYDANDLHERSDKIARSGFRHIFFRNAEVFADPHSTMSGKVLVLNMFDLALYVWKRANFKQGMWIEPSKQRIRVKKLTTTCALGYGHPKIHGYGAGITT